MNKGQGHESIVKSIIERARDQVKLECRSQVFEEGKKLTSDDLKIPQDPEEFTKRYIIERVFQLVGAGFQTGERRFRVPGGTRKADYGVVRGGVRFLVEAKPINDDLYRSHPDGAVTQIKGLFLLQEAKDNYDYGVATDGLKWIFINSRGDVVGEFSLAEDYSRIKEFITGRRKVREERRQAEISKRFYQWYNALLHGGSFRDLKNRQRSIREEDCLVKNVINVRSDEDQEEIAQVIVDRLIFIKFLQTKEIIREDILEYLSTLPEDMLNEKMRQLFFSVLNTEVARRIAVDPKFSAVPYLNGSLFTMTRAEERNPTYRIKAEILKEIIKFLDAFRFVSEGEAAKEGLNPEILGYIFERAMTATDRKGTGAYYTPKTITRYICENTIYPYIFEKTREYLKEKKGYKDAELPKNFEDILNLRSLTLRDIYADVIQTGTVLDPACGSGAFLLDAAKVLFEIYQRVEDSLGAVGRNPDIVLKKIILRDSIYGVDINRKGIEIAKLRLWLWVADSYEPGGRVEALPNIEYNIRAGNSLVGYVDIEKFREAMVSMDDFLGLEKPVMELIRERDSLLKEYKFASGERARELKRKIEELDAKIKRRLDIHLFQDMMTRKIDIKAEDFSKLDPVHWGFEFHKVFENSGGGFSVVIGNPPYIRQEALGDFKKILKEYYEVYHGLADIYTYFFERGHKILRQGGLFGFISSNKFLHASYGNKLKKFLSEVAYVKQIPDFGDLPVFEDATTYPAIFITEKTDVRSSTIYAPIPTLDFVNLSDAVKEYGFEIPPEYMGGTDWKLRNPLENQILDKMNGLSIPLYEYTKGKAKRGIVTGLTEAFVIDNTTRNQLIKEDPRSEEIIKPFIIGDDVGRYEVNFQERYLIYVPWELDIRKYPAILKHLSKFEEKLKSRPEVREGRFKWYSLSRYASQYVSEFDKPKIVYLVFQVKPAFCFDENNFYSNNAVWIIPTNKKFLLSILNSKVGWFLISRHCTKIRNGYQLIWDYLKKIPIRRISFSTPQAEREKLVAELKEYYAQGEFDKILSVVEVCLPKDEEGNFIPEKEKSDIVHDLLAFLAEQMIEMNKEKNSEIKSFLKWLEGYTKVKVDEMVLKSKVREYYKHDWEEMRLILARNKGKIKEVDVTRREPQEKIRMEYEDSIRKLKPLLKRIEDTDNLIDEVIYKLYGLIEEEIMVVEGG